MRFLLDTNACIALLNGSSPALAQRLSQCHPRDVATSSVVKAELYFGARKSQRVAENLAAIDRLCRPFASLPFDDRCGEEYGSIRAELEAVGRPIGANDMMIAATARCHRLTLVTRNTSEFSRVTGLALEDWQRASDG